MATTGTHLYRSLMGDAYKKTKIELGVYPGDGILDPRWQQTQYFNKKRNQWVISNADVDTEPGKNGPEVLAGGGTSLHDVPGWFPCKEFWIPKGTEYSDEISIVKDAKKKTSTANASVSGWHYQLEPRTRMTVVAFKGALDNMARAAVVKQLESVKV